MSERGVRPERGGEAWPSPPARRPRRPDGSEPEPEDAKQAADRDVDVSTGEVSTGEVSTGEVSKGAGARIAELEDQRLRALADLDNLRKKCARQLSQAQAETTARVARLWLPVLDNLDLALQHADADPGSIVEGIKAVREQGLSALAQLGFARRDDLGASFDPARHEAVASHVDPAVADGTVIGVVRPGYGDGDSQLRPAQVIVAKAE
jgi:molecular chaperone GrpE